MPTEPWMYLSVRDAIQMAENALGNGLTREEWTQRNPTLAVKLDWGLSRGFDWYRISKPLIMASDEELCVQESAWLWSCVQLVFFHQWVWKIAAVESPPCLCKQLLLVHLQRLTQLPPVPLASAYIVVAPLIRDLSKACVGKLCPVDHAWLNACVGSLRAIHTCAISPEIPLYPPLTRAVYQLQQALTPNELRYWMKELFLATTYLQDWPIETSHV